MSDDLDDIDLTIFIPDEMCWWCHGQFDERRVYPDIPAAINLHGIKFQMTTGLQEFRFEDGDDAYVCHRCMSDFYRFAQRCYADRVALNV